MAYDELVAHARKFNHNKLVPAFDPCEKSYVIELIHALDTLPVSPGFAPNPTMDLIDSVHMGVGQALLNYSSEEYYNDGEHVMEYVLALYTEIGDSEAIDAFREGLSAAVVRGTFSEHGEEYPSMYETALVYRADDGRRTCFMVRSDEAGCEMWLVFTVEPKHIG